MKWNLESTVELSNGVRMPRLGLGVYQTPPGKTTENAVTWALQAGYRHIDTARVYRNEADVGKAIRESGIPRRSIFLTTKLWTGDHGYDSTLRGFESSFANLRVEYIDLFLSHFPVQGKRIDTWKAMQTLLKDGRCRAVGVSNYTIRHLREIEERTGVIPAVNQVEFSPFLYQRELLEYCQAKRIQLEAYSPLTQGQKLGHPKVVAIGQHQGKSAAQVLIRWALQHDLVVIPKSVRQARIVENAQVFDFELTAEQMRTLDGLNENLRVCWDPSDTP
jgi:diketogulonate reductase-like aldo/keto reductase